MHFTIDEAFALLGLPPGADEGRIKRAYAVLLRRHRPDEDPGGFQRLNEAFNRALASTRTTLPQPFQDAGWRLSPVALVEGRLTDERTHAFSTDRANGDSAKFDSGATSSRVDAQAFASTVLDLCTSDADMSTLSRKLLTEPSLYDLNLKHRTGMWLLSALPEGGVPLDPEALDVLSEFFGWCRISRGDGGRAEFAERKLRNNRKRWQVWRSVPPSAPAGLPRDVQLEVLADLRDRTTRLATFLRGLDHRWASAAHIALCHFSGLFDGRLPPAYKTEQYEVLASLVDPTRLSLPRAARALILSALFAAPFALLGALMVSPHDGLVIAASLVAATYFGWFVYSGAVSVLTRLAERGYDATWWRRASVPLAVGLAIVGLVDLIYVDHDWLWLAPALGLLALVRTRVLGALVLALPVHMIDMLASGLVVDSVTSSAFMLIMMALVGLTDCVTLVLTWGRRPEIGHSSGPLFLSALLILAMVLVKAALQ